MLHCKKTFLLGVLCCTLFLLASSAFANPPDPPASCQENACDASCKTYYKDNPGAVCFGEVQPWCFEKSLGIEPFGGKDFQPGNGLEFLGWLFFALLTLTAVLALGWMTWAGIQYIYAAGNSSRQLAAKQKIWNSIYGLVLALAAILLLYNINPELTKLQLPSMPLNTTKEINIIGCLEGKGYKRIPEGDSCGRVCPNGTRDIITPKSFGNPPGLTLTPNTTLCLCGAPPTTPPPAPVPGFTLDLLKKFCTDTMGGQATINGIVSIYCDFFRPWMPEEREKWNGECQSFGGFPGPTPPPNAPPEELRKLTCNLLLP